MKTTTVDARHGSVSSLGRRAVSFGIVIYLAILGGGVLIHTFDLPARQYLSAYLVVWDMFCGWDGFERRVQFVAEGASGQYYDAGEVPGRGTHPHGPVSRRNFDYRNSFSGEFITDILARTEHEPIRRVYVVEEQWSKRYNVPTAWREPVGPERKPIFRHVQAIYDADGQALQTKPQWSVIQATRAVYDNPRLRHAMNQTNVLFAQTAPSSDSVGR